MVNDINNIALLGAGTVGAITATTGINSMPDFRSGLIDNVFDLPNSQKFAITGVSIAAAVLSYAVLDRLYPSTSKTDKEPDHNIEADNVVHNLVEALQKEDTLRTRDR